MEGFLGQEDETFEEGSLVVAVFCDCNGFAGWQRQHFAGHRARTPAIASRKREHFLCGRELYAPGWSFTIAI